MSLIDTATIQPYTELTFDGDSEIDFVPNYANIIINGNLKVNTHIGEHARVVVHGHYEGLDVLKDAHLKAESVALRNVLSNATVISTKEDITLTGRASIHTTLDSARDVTYGTVESPLWVTYTRINHSADIHRGMRRQPLPAHYQWQHYQGRSYQEKELGLGITFDGKINHYHIPLSVYESLDHLILPNVCRHLMERGATCEVQTVVSPKGMQEVVTLGNDHAVPGLNQLMADHLKGYIATIQSQSR